MSFKKYITAEGDTWDYISYLEYGNSSNFSIILNANPQYSGIPVLPAGLELSIPILEDEISNIPPWER